VEPTPGEFEVVSQGNHDAHNDEHREIRAHFEGTYDAQSNGAAHAEHGGCNELILGN